MDERFLEHRLVVEAFDAELRRKRLEDRTKPVTDELLKLRRDFRRRQAGNLFEFQSELVRDHGLAKLTYSSGLGLAKHGIQRIGKTLPLTHIRSPHGSTPCGRFTEPTDTGCRSSAGLSEWEARYPFPAEPAAQCSYVEITTSGTATWNQRLGTILPVIPEQDGPNFSYTVTVSSSGFGFLNYGGDWKPSSQRLYLFMPDRKVTPMILEAKKIYDAVSQYRELNEDVTITTSSDLAFTDGSHVLRNKLVPGHLSFTAPMKVIGACSALPSMAQSMAGPKARIRLATTNNEDITDVPQTGVIGQKINLIGECSATGQAIQKEWWSVTDSTISDYVANNHIGKTVAPDFNYRETAFFWKDKGFKMSHTPVKSPAGKLFRRTLHS